MITNTTIVSTHFTVELYSIVQRLPDATGLVRGTSTERSEPKAAGTKVISEIYCCQPQRKNRL